MPPKRPAQPDFFGAKPAAAKTKKDELEWNVVDNYLVTGLTHHFGATEPKAKALKKTKESQTKESETKEPETKESETRDSKSSEDPKTIEESKTSEDPIASEESKIKDEPGSEDPDSVKHSADDESGTKPVIVAAFDMDGTLIDTKSGYKFSRGPNDWKWLYSSVPEVLRHLHAGSVPDGQVHEDIDTSIAYKIVIFSNQGAVIPIPGRKSLTNLQGRVNQFVADADVPVRYYAAARAQGVSQRIYRKPDIGMWEQLAEDLGTPIDMSKSFYVGDAAGRHQDHSDADIGFAKGVGLKFYTPEQFFKE